jgi:hypothetical protein
MAISYSTAISLNRGDILYHGINKNADGSPQRWKVNGKVQVWKNEPYRFKIPVKYGLYGFGYVTDKNSEPFYTKEKCALRHKEITALLSEITHTEQK